MRFCPPKSRIAKIEYIANTIPISDVFKPSSRKSNELNLLLMDENNINSNQNKTRGLCNTLFVPGSAFNTISSSLSIGMKTVDDFRRPPLYTASFTPGVAFIYFLYWEIVYDLLLLSRIVFSISYYMRG